MGGLNNSNRVPLKGSIRVTIRDCRVPFLYFALRLGSSSASQLMLN